MKKTEAFISVTISIFIVFFSIFFFLNEKKEFSENENRYLKKFPQYSFSSLESGKYTEQIKDYLTDHFPFRDFMMGFKTTTYKLLGIKEINNVYLSSEGYLIEKFDGVNNSDKIINTINQFQDKLGFTINVMLVPTSISINEDKLPQYAPHDNQLETIKEMYQKLNTNTIDVATTLLENKDKYQLYYKLDHHWTSYGAYTAYLAYTEALNLTPRTEYNIDLITDSFYGTLYSKTNDYMLKPDSIYRFTLSNSNYTVIYDNTKITDTLYADSYLEKKDKYSYFLDSNHSLIEIVDNNSNSNDEILIIKDSYANSFVPFIVNNYKRVYVIDPRYYKAPISEFIQEKDIDNVLFLYNINTINNDLGIISVH